MEKLKSTTVRLILCFVVLCIPGLVSAQINLTVKNQEVRQVIKLIEKKSDYKFFYSNDLPDMDKRVSVDAKNDKVEKVLDQIFSGTRIKYRIGNNKQITLSEKEAEKPISSTPSTSSTITGTVTDETGEELIGVSVVIKGTNTAAMTDLSGKYSISVPQGSVLEFSYIGYNKKSVPVTQGVINVRMEQNAQLLNEVVVIGYGSITKKDATGSVGALKINDLNKGVSATPQDMLTGKIPGLLIVPGDGGPASGTTIRIRNGSSLTANNSPLIVIDGVPTSNDAGVGMSNALGTINPSDIESFNVLKDASATAIYGSRASNGVIIITTKKGDGSKLKIGYSGTFSANVNSKQVPVLDADEFRQYIDEYYPVSTTQGAAAHKAINYTYPDGSINSDFRTDWQKEIFQTALSNDHNINVSGGGKNYPFRISLGYTNQDGTLKGSTYRRFTQAVSFNPSFFNNHLKVTLNAKAMENENNYVDNGAINSAASFDPTKPIYAYQKDGSISNQYHGYFQWLNPDGTINRNGSENPVSKLNDYYDHTDVFRSLGNAQLDYSFHFLPELHANLNMGYDYTKDNGHKGNYPGSYASYTDAILTPGQGRYTDSYSVRKNMLLDFYLNYTKSLKSIKSSVNAMAGYSWQHFYKSDESNTYSNQTDQYESTFITGNYTPKEYYLVSFFGRLNYTLMDKYMATFTLRDDGTSRYSPNNRWGLFPSAALAWRMSDEDFLKPYSNLSNLKLRLSYGVTGQQDIGDDYYPYIPVYNLSTATSTSKYLIGDKYYQILKPEAYNENIKWESTATYNIGFDWGFFKNRLSGSVDGFVKKTYDLLNSIPIPAGSNFTNKMTANIGNLESKGIEFNINATPISTNDFSWEIGFNATWLESKITKLTAVVNPDYVGVPTGGISFGTGSNIQIHSVGYAPNTFYVYEQVYDQNGNPIQNAVVDQDKNGLIDDKDLVLKHKSRPDAFYGINMQFRYKKWDFGFNTHGSIGNWVFNDYNSARCSADYTFSNGQTTRNIPSFVYDVSKFSLPITVTQAKSDLFLENASFFKVDNITLGRSVSNLFNSKLSGRIYFTAQNPFVMTNYTGMDPEVSSGIDNNPWPRPRIYVLGLNINF